MHEAAIMDSKRSNKIREIVKLQQILKKWKKLATSSSSSATAATAGRVATTSNNKGIKFFKRTLSFTDVVVSWSDSVVVVPKGFLAVCVGEELKRFTIPMEYLSHPSFQVLLREAEEEFGFHQVGVLRIPCHVSLFEKVLKVVEQKRPMFFGEDKDASLIGCYGSDCEVTPTHHHAVQTCR